jgi:cytochrome P450
MDERGRQAITESTAYFYDVVQQRRAQPGEGDLFSLFMAAEIERDDGGITGLSDFEIMGFASQLGGAGAETVTTLLASARYLFARHPDQWAKPPDDRSLISAAVEELLRYDNPVHYDVRRSVKDSTLHGVTIPIGKPVFPMLASANRDREAWTDADVRHRAEPHRGPESGAGLRHPQLPGRRARTDGNRHRAGEVARLHASL